MDARRRQAEIDSLTTRTSQAILVAILASDEYFAAAAKYGASIHWGDGSTSPGTIQQNAGGCTVVGTHSYSSNGRRTLAVDVTSPDGNKVTLTRSLTITPPPPPPPGKENVRPSGKVFIKKGGKFVPLTDFAQVPLGTELDTRKGKVTLTSHDGSTGDFYEGIFKLGAEKERRTTFTVIVLTGGNFAGCQTYKRTVSGVGEDEAEAGIEVDPPRLGQCEGPLPDEGQVRLGDGPRHALADKRCLRGHMGARPPRRCRRLRLRPAQARLHPRRALVPREAQEVEAVLLREREPEPGERPADHEQQRCRVGEAQVAELVARDAGEVPGGDRHRVEDLALGRAPDRVAVLRAASGKAAPPRRNTASRRPGRRRGTSVRPTWPTAAIAKRMPKRQAIVASQPQPGET